jgi:hypothetical protein
LWVPPSQGTRQHPGKKKKFDSHLKTLTNIRNP